MCACVCPCFRFIIIIIISKFYYRNLHFGHREFSLIMRACVCVVWIDFRIVLKMITFKCRLYGLVCWLAVIITRKMNIHIYIYEKSTPPPNGYTVLLSMHARLTPVKMPRKRNVRTVVVLCWCERCLYAFNDDLIFSFIREYLVIYHQFLR